MNQCSFSDQVRNGDCIHILRSIPTGSVDLVVTDPPYLVNYRDRQNRSILNDTDPFWLKPAFSQTFRVLKANSLCISFYGWHEVDTFMSAWKSAGFRPVGHIVWPKRYTSRTGYLAYAHEQAYLLAKGRPPRPSAPLRDVQRWHYSGNRQHPTQKSVEILKPLVRTYSKPGDLVLDPFCGSGSTAMAAKLTGRRYLAIEKDTRYFTTAQRRLAGQHS